MQVEDLHVQPVVAVLGHRPAIGRFRLQSHLELMVLWWVCLEGVHPSVNDALTEDL